LKSVNFVKVIVNVNGKRALEGEPPLSYDVQLVP
jgi:hypothetical protein